MTRVPVSMNVNGRERAEFIESGTLLVDFLRDKLGLYATKMGCQQGTCGSCTIMIDGELALSCLVPAERANGRNVVTLEGIVPQGAAARFRSGLCLSVWLLQPGDDRRRQGAA
jgi:aerobic carbon-monoxide dehydrogenase small subunit